MSGRNHKTPEQLEKFRRAIVSGKTKGDALRAAGYAETSARVSGSTINQSTPLQMAYSEALRELASRPVPEPMIRAGLIRNKLVENIVTGKDRAPQSLKLAMQDRELNMLTPDSQIGIIMLGELPKAIDVPDLPELPELPESATE